MLDEGMYYEIEYDSTPMPGVGKFVLKNQKIEASEKDEVRELFNRMRDIARNSRLSFYTSTKFYNDRVRQENSEIFYKQGMFMKDFEDDYEEAIPYKQYFPYYQMMGYKQLRTYFTWRTQVRRGRVEETSLSYAYLYLYELLGNIGVSDAQDGLDKLWYFWQEFRAYEPSIDKYVLRWLKDYHIYYDLPQPFVEFVKEKKLEEYYPELPGSNDRFELFCTFSKYDITKSNFYTQQYETLIHECFAFTMDRLNLVFAEHGMDLDNAIFFPTKSQSAWRPFQDALFYPWREQRDRNVVLSSKEVYVCSRNRWTHQTSLTTESGKKLVGYILKQMESVLRETVNYKYKITAGISVLHPETSRRLEEAGIALEQCVTDAVKEFYRESTKTIVTVDRDSLAKIRREALETQKKLLVPEDGAEILPVPVSVTVPQTEVLNVNMQPEVTPEQAGPWQAFSLALTPTERQALRHILHGDVDIRHFAADNNIMSEVLMDGINEKAVDTVGDSVLYDEFMIYDDYLEQIREVLER